VADVSPPLPISTCTFPLMGKKPLKFKPKAQAVKPVLFLNIFAYKNPFYPLIFA
jgi:hypothetical protein